MAWITHFSNQTGLKNNSRKKRKEAVHARYIKQQLGSSWFWETKSRRSENGPDIEVESESTNIFNLGLMAGIASKTIPNRDKKMLDFKWLGFQINTE